MKKVQERDNIDQLFRFDSGITHCTIYRLKYGGHELVLFVDFFELFFLLFLIKGRSLTLATLLPNQLFGNSSVFLMAVFKDFFDLLIFTLLFS